jgi:hypothetical protein
MDIKSHRIVLLEQVPPDERQGEDLSSPSRVILGLNWLLPILDRILVLAHIPTLYSATYIARCILSSK